MYKLIGTLLPIATLAACLSNVHGQTGTRAPTLPAMAPTTAPTTGPATAGEKVYWTPKEPYQPMELLKKRELPAGPWTFVAFGDSHISESKIKASRGGTAEQWTQIVKLVENQNPDLVLLLGDLDGDNNGDFQPLFNLGGEAFKEKPWFFAIGNHDFPKGSTTFGPVWDRIFKGPGCTPERAYYAVDRGNVRFLHISCMKVSNFDAGMSKGVEEWVTQQFASFKGDHLVMFNHFAPYTPTKYRYADGLKDLEKSLYAKYRGNFSITLVSGHVHQYYRTARGGANYFTICAGLSGNHGHSKMVPENKRELLPDDVFMEEQGIGVFTVDGKTIRFEYKTLKDGKVLDTCKIEPKP